jgi:acyl-CoA thioesterase-1
MRLAPRLITALLALVLVGAGAPPAPAFQGPAFQGPAFQGPAFQGPAFQGPAFQGLIVAFGDSLTAGYGVAPDESYPGRLAARIKAEGYPYRVANAGVSGDTTAGGLRRVEWVLQLKPDIVIVALGANDGLRAQDVGRMRANLDQIVARFQQSGATVLLAGMRLPPNYGRGYAQEFQRAFDTVAKARNTALMPFLLDGVAAEPALNQADGVHPTADGYRVVADRLWEHLRPLLRR